MLRQFHFEEFVDHNVQDSEASSQKLVFTTESIENIESGWRARETYVVHGATSSKIFELAQAESRSRCILAHG